jgi:hypothetical protein
MINLLYKEFRLVITTPYMALLLFALLLLIPNWVYFVAMMYILFIGWPNLFMSTTAMNDIRFTVMLPIRKRDVVKARVLSLATLELLQLAAGAVTAVINMNLYPAGNFLIDANIAFLGCVLVMYGLFNLAFFPLYYKRASKVGKPTLIGTAAAILFAFIIEALVLTSPTAARMLDGIAIDALIRQIPIFASGIVIFVALSFAAYKWAARNFEKVDL